MRYTVRGLQLNRPPVLLGGSGWVAGGAIDVATVLVDHHVAGIELLSFGKRGQSLVVVPLSRAHHSQLSIHVGRRVERSGLFELLQRLGGPAGGFGGQCPIHQQTDIRFVNIPTHCEIFIFSESGDLMAHIEHDDTAKTSGKLGEMKWGQMSGAMTGEISSGVYFFVVRSLMDGSLGKTKSGKFFIIK